MNTSNKVISLRTMNTIDDEASIWLVRLDNGNLSEQARQELKAWLAADERHLIALKTMADIWDEMDEVLNFIDDKQASAKVSLWSIVKPVISPVMLAASISFLALILWLTSPMEAQRNSYATLAGQQLDTRFNDGSIVHLNTNSQIETEFTDEKRIIKLMKGEALFEVAHDANRPFIVYAGDRLVQAVGTKFVVHLTTENLQVTVTDGKVKMAKVALDTELTDIQPLSQDSLQADDVFIAKGEQAIVASEQAPTISQVDAENINRELAWLDGKLVFDNEALFDVIAELNRYTDVEIVLNDSSLHQVRISGRFDLGDSDALIEALELSFNIKSQRLSDKKILLSKKL